MLTLAWPGGGSGACSSGIVMWDSAALVGFSPLELDRLLEASCTLPAFYEAQR